MHSCLVALRLSALYRITQFWASSCQPCKLQIHSVRSDCRTQTAQASMAAPQPWLNPRNSATGCHSGVSDTWRLINTGTIIIVLMVLLILIIQNRDASSSWGVRGELCSRFLDYIFAAAKGNLT